MACKYSGKVCIVHGKMDKIVPYSYSEKYNELYKNSELHLLDNEKHFMSSDKQKATSLVITFVKENVYICS